MEKLTSLYNLDWREAPVPATQGRFLQKVRRNIKRDELMPYFFIPCEVFFSGVTVPKKIIIIIKKFV